MTQEEKMKYEIATLEIATLLAENLRLREWVAEADGQLKKISDWINCSVSIPTYEATRRMIEIKELLDKESSIASAYEVPEPIADDSGGGHGLCQMPPPGAITDAAYLAGWFEGQQYLIDNATSPNPTNDNAVREALDAAKKAEDAMREMFRYFDGGEMRGSYDGKPERAGLRNAWYGLRSALATLAKRGGAEG